MYLSALLRTECFCVGSSFPSSSSLLLFIDEARGRGISLCRVVADVLFFFCCFWTYLRFTASFCCDCSCFSGCLSILLCTFFGRSSISLGCSCGGGCCVGDGTCWGEGLSFDPIYFLPGTVWGSSVTALSVAATTAAVVVVIVGRGEGCEFLAGHALDMCAEAPHDQQ